MVLVADIYDEVKKIVGNNSDTFIFKRLTDAVELLANKGDWDPLVGSLDICVQSRVVTLPREVETILALNENGNPAVARDQLFTFHLNGPGDCGARLTYEWQNLGNACVYRELTCPAKLVAYCTLEADEDCVLWVEGFDQLGNVVRTETEAGWVNGYQVPVLFTYQALPEGAPTFSRITAVRKSETKGSIRLSSLDNDDCSGVLLGLYAWDETVPSYRRIKVSRCVSWVRIVYRKSSYKITSQSDLIMLHNRQAVIMAVRALKHYDSVQGIAEGEACEATATRWLTEEQYTRNSPVVQPIQVHDANPLVDNCDYVD